MQHSLLLRIHESPYTRVWARSHGKSSFGDIDDGVGDGDGDGDGVVW